EALRRLLRRDFSLILMDVRMPDMDGFETADLIRKSERLRHVPIIFLSAIDTLEADVYRGAAKGAVDYLLTGRARCLEGQSVGVRRSVPYQRAAQAKGRAAERR